MGRLIPTLLAVALLVGLVMLFRTAQRFDPSATPAIDRQALGDISIQFGKAEIVSRAAGQRQWYMQADHIDLRRVQGGDLDQFRAADFKGIRNGIVYRTGKPEASFSAAAATYDQSAQRFDVHGGIRMRTAKGEALTSEDLVWSQKDDFVRFPSGAKWTFGEDTIAAPNLLYSPKKRIVQCQQGADAMFRGYPLHASVLYWDLDKNRVDLPGPVYGERKGISFRAARASMDLKSHDLWASQAHIRLRIRGDTLEMGELQ